MKLFFGLFYDWAHSLNKKNLKLRLKFDLFINK